MPLTPLHLGPALVLAVFLRRRVSVEALLIGSVVLDAQPFAVLFLGMPFALHGLSHTFAASALVALALALVMHPFTKQGVRPLFYGALLGVWSHVLLDSFLYEDMAPLLPLDGNPFLHLLAPGVVYLMCALSFVLAAAINLKLLKKDKLATQGGA